MDACLRERGDIIRKAILALVVLFLLATLPQGSSLGQVVVKVGDLGIAAYAPIYMSIDKGYFKETEIEVKLERFASGAQMMAPLSTGELQAGVGTVPR